MNRNVKGFRALLLLGSAGALAVPVAGLAQEAGSQSGGGSPSAEEGAQETSGTTAPEAGANQIIVTGSRIARRDYSATSPIVTVDAELIEETSQINLEANLNKLPQFSPALTQFNTGDFQATALNTIGISTVSLRQLGSNRNLVLLNGRRGTPVSGTGVTDINSIPSAAVQRVEIITGGASSTYGADAVGGVVNFILKDKFTGISIDAQGGMSERGDGEEYRISSLVGANIDDGRGNVMLGMEYYNRESILRVDRPWYEAQLSSPDVGGSEFFLEENAVAFLAGNQPNQNVLNAYFVARGAPAGVAIPRNSVSLNDDGSLFINTSARPGGVYVPLFYGYKGEIDGLSQKITANGLLAQNNLEELLSTPQNRYSFFAKGEYEIIPEVRFISQARFARTRTKTLGLNTVALGSFGVNIPYDNNLYAGNPTFGTPSSRLANGNTHPDYLPGGRFGLSCPAVGGCTNKQVFPVPADVALMLDSRPTPNGIWRADIVPTSIGRRFTDNFVTTYEMLAGFEGEIPGTDWTWEVIGAFGETIAKTDTYGFFSGDAFRTIVSSPNYGAGFRAQGNGIAPGGNRNGATAVCTSGISPFNATQVYSEDCGVAVRVDAQVENRLKQKFVEANLQGGLFELPAGEVRFAAGTHLRTNSMNYHADSSSVEGATFYETVNGIFPQGSTEGSITVKEAYGELLIPVLADMPFVEELNLELGYRISDYSTVGTSTTYKVNGEWAPTDWLRFRGGYQKASRAPNLGEVFTSLTQTLATANDGDPCSRGNTTAPVNYGIYSANPIGFTSDLAPNPADTVGNPNAAQVEGLCRQIMGAQGAAEYYRAGRTYSTGSVFITSVASGRGDLQEETAKTYTIGAVISSPFEDAWLRRLRMSADYYNVKLTDGISLRGVDSTFRQCFNPLLNPDFELNEACLRIQRDPTSGELQQVGITYSNLGAVETSGFDVQLDWGVDFADVGIPIPGSFSFNTNFTYLLKFATTPDQVVIQLLDYAGTTGGGEVGTNPGSYRWKLFSRFNYNVGPFGIGLQWRHLPAIDHITTVTSTNSTFTGAPAYDLFNLSGRYAVNESLNLRFGIDNLFDKWPPIIAEDTSVVAGDGRLRGGRFDAGNYDTLGRRFYVGVNVEF